MEEYSRLQSGQLRQGRNPGDGLGGEVLVLESDIAPGCCGRCVARRRCRRAARGADGAAAGSRHDAAAIVAPRPAAQRRLAAAAARLRVSRPSLASRATSSPPAAGSASIAALASCAT